MKKLLILFALVVLVACSSDKTKLVDLSEDGEIAKRYVEDLGYEVVALEQEDVLRFTKENMNLPPNKQFWAVQAIEPTPYINKDLVRIKFLVKNHPLAYSYESDKTRVEVVLWNGEVIGGSSAPYSKEPLVGGNFALNGKAAEEVKETYTLWSEEWDQTYGAY